MANKRANTNIIANKATYNTKIHAKNYIADDIRKTDAYIIAFAFFIMANGNWGY